jgi:hypothetical protein
MSESNNNYTEAPEFDHLGCATTLLRSIGTDVNKDPRLLTPKVTAQIQLAEEALAAALREIHAAKGTLRVEDEANSEKDKIISKANFNTYFGDLNGRNFANMDELNAAIKASYLELHRNTNNGVDNKIGISGFRNSYAVVDNDVNNLDETALAEINFSIENVPYKLLLLGFRAYLSQDAHKHTIILYRKSTFEIDGITYQENRPYEIEHS